MDAAPTLLEAPPRPASPAPPPASRKLRGAALGGWTALACVLLVASGFLRIWQARRLEIPSNTVGRPPFTLKSLPPVLGNWRILTGTERKLADDVAQVSGCTEHLIRDYVDTDTGVVVTLLIGYGPAELVHCHSPDICFPAAGFLPIGESKDTELTWGEDEDNKDKNKDNKDTERTWGQEKAKDSKKKGSAIVRSGIYDSTTGLGQGVRYEAYYSLRHAGRWYPEAVYKAFRKEPAMYRLLLQRRVLASERREPGNPSEQFLTALLPELERRIAEATQSQAPAPAPAVAAR